MKRLIVCFLLVAALVVATVGMTRPATAQALSVEYLKALDSGIAYGGANGLGYDLRSPRESFSCKFTDRDTAETFVLWFGRSKLYPLANDVTFILESDTTYFPAVSVSSLAASMTLYPIVANRDGGRVAAGMALVGDVLLDMGRIPVRCGTVTPLTTFTLNPDSSYAFHDTLWWGGMDVLGIYGKIILEDSALVDITVEYMGNR